jgi:hypothetical protein
MSLGKVIVIAPNEEDKYVIWHHETASLEEPPLCVLRELVGGHVNTLMVRYEGKRVSAYFDADGETRNLPVNPAGSLLVHFQLRGKLVIELETVRRQ